MRLALLLMLLSMVPACSEPAPTQVWTPADHAHPPESEIDPSRRPSAARMPREVLLWQGLCAGCHGQQGAGDGDQFPNGIDFRSAAWQEKLSDDEIVKVIQVGRAPMPAFAEMLSAADLDLLVKYIRAMGPSAAK